MTSRLGLVLCLFTLSPPAMADFVPDDQLVSDPTSDFQKPEFDGRTQRVIWQDLLNRLWIARVDPVTGAVIPANGKGQMLDSSLSPGGTIGNTPRYTYGTGQSAIVYNKDVGGVRTLAKAEEVAPDSWMTALLENGSDRWKANGTPEETLGPPRIVYDRMTPEGDTVVSWRILDDPASEQTTPGIKGGRFLGAEPSVILMAADGNNIVQIYEVPFATGIPEQATFGPDHKMNAFIWWAPEFHEYLFVAMVNWAELAVFRRIDGQWTNINQFPVPSSMPYLSSPEGFAVNGKSYVTVVAAEELGAGGFVGQPIGPTEIWVAGIDPAEPFFRRIDDPGYVAQRSEPEPFLLQNGWVVYYSERPAESQGGFEINLLKRAVTGLEDRTGYDSGRYGGPWSTTYRDNTNCACTPYAIPQQYESAHVALVPNVQFVHPALGPEGHLYFGITASGGTGSIRQLVAVDSATGAETYRIDETETTSNISATVPLIDNSGEYYIAANEAVSKFRATGERVWQLPTHGLARGAQFLPDGNVLFFTWNGWAYVVAPSGALLLERNLTPGRVYPADPSCLKPAPNFAADCAYVGPPAVDAYSGRVYATFVMASGDSALQAFQYRTTPTISLTPVWPTRSILLSGVATTPVLSADYSRLYLHDGAGNLVARNAANGQLIWSFPLGFRSDQPPAVSGGGYLMPGGNVDQDANHNFVGLVRDEGAGASWTFQTSAYVPKSYAAAGAADRFVLAATEGAGGALKLLVADPAGVVSASPWGSGVVPSTLKSVTLRDDGWAFVQSWGNVAVKAFQPTSPSP